MIRVFAVCCGLGIGRILAAVLPLEHSISTSRQFVVYGTDLALRGALCDLAERTKRELLTLLAQRDTWVAPIVVNARYPQTNLPELSRLNVDLGQTGFGLKIQLDLVIDSGLGRPEIRKELLRALMLEIMYRGQPQLPAGSVYASPPGWLLEGIPGQQSDMPRDRAAALLALPVATGNVLPLEKFLAQRPELLDASSRNLYRAYSFALVDLLGRPPEGPRRLTRFILDLPAASNDSMADLRRHFPEMFQPEEAEKTWQKQVARLSAGQPYHLMSSAETRRRLEGALRLRITESGKEKRYDLKEFPIFLKHRSAKKALRLLEHEIAILAARANPLYAPIIAEYGEVIGLLQRGRTLSVPRRLERLGNWRGALAAQMQSIDDYLNWFEATSLIGPSGEFAEYMKAAERAAQREQTKRDPISVYLDALETQFESNRQFIR